MTRTCSQRVLGISATYLALAWAAPSAHAQSDPAPAAPSNESPPATALGAETPPVASAVPPAAPAAPGTTPEGNAAGSESAKVPTADAASDAEAAAAAAAAAAAVEAELQSSSAASDSEFKLNLYGFADFSYSVPLGGAEPPTGAGSFAVGKLNLYTAAELGDDWRSLAEVRFMYLPNGAGAALGSADQSRTDTSVPDYTDYQRSTKWGGILIERVWLEHTFHPALTVRAGQWLTPYGIWNVDHGSPVIIPVHRPFIIGETLFPERQTGIEAYGTLSFGPSQLGYHLTLSNGRGPVDTYQDFDHNKAIGWRLFVKYDSDYGEVTVGTSGYRGKYSDVTSSAALDANNQIAMKQTVVARYDELSLAADLKWEWNDFLAQGEFIANDIAYPDAHRVFDPGLSGGPAGFGPDHRRFGVYGLAGYRTPFFGIMPWVGAETYDPGWISMLGGMSSASRNAGYMAGIHARPTPRVVLKAQYMRVFLFNLDIGSMQSLDLQAAWSF